LFFKNGGSFIVHVHNFTIDKISDNVNLKLDKFGGTKIDFCAFFVFWQKQEEVFMAKNKARLGRGH